MPITRKVKKECNGDRSEENVKLDLELLANFLNFPYAERGEKSFDKKDPLSRLKRLHPFAEAFEFDSAWTDMKAAADLQKELLQVLDPLIGQRLKNKGLVKNRLERLVAKINSLNLKFDWIVVPADEERRVPYFDPKTHKPIPNTERNIPSPWKESGHAILEIWGTRWIVTKSIVKQWSLNIESARRLLFSIVALSLDKRELSDLRRCGLCQKFFVNSDGRSNYCTASHQRVYARQEARNTMRQRRGDEKKQRDVERREAEEKANRRDKELKLVILFDSVFKRDKLPMPVVAIKRKWKAKLNGRQLKEFVKSLSAAEFSHFETDCNVLSQYVTHS